MPVIYLLSSFSFNMISTEDLESGVHVDTEKIDSLPDGLTSAVGHEDTAKILGVEMNRISVTLHRGDVCYVAQYKGERLPEGCTTLPKGAKLMLLKVTVS